MSPKFWDTYDPSDKRREVILTKYYTTAGTWIDRNTTTWDGFIINKFPVETATAFQGTDIPLARWADVLLMYAEAEVRKNNAAPSADAIAAVNEVRKRAGLGDLPSSATANVEAFLEALLTERGHEMLYEGMRKIDLIRFNQYAQRTAKIKGVAPTHQFLIMRCNKLRNLMEKCWYRHLNVRDGKRILRQLAINVIIHYC